LDFFVIISKKVHTHLLLNYILHRKLLLSVKRNTLKFHRGGFFIKVGNKESISCYISIN